MHVYICLCSLNFLLQRDRRRYMADVHGEARGKKDKLNRLGVSCRRRDGACYGTYGKPPASAVLLWQDTPQPLYVRNRPARIRLCVFSLLFYFIFPLLIWLGIVLMLIYRYVLQRITIHDSMKACLARSVAPWIHTWWRSLCRMEGRQGGPVFLRSGVRTYLYCLDW